MRKNRAFTLVELLVVIAIIGVLVALLLPAIQAAREAARRNSCTNNLKQQGLALQMHHDVKKVLPQGRNGTTPGPGTATAPLGVSWAFQLLPYMEQNAIYDSLVNTERVDSQANARAMRTPVDTFVCPSRRSPSEAGTRDFDNDDAAPADEHRGVAAGGDYAGNAGIDRDYRKDSNESPERALQEGVIYTFSKVNLRYVSDGTAATFAIGEKYIPTEDELRLEPAQFDENRIHYMQGDTCFFCGDNVETIMAGTECGLAPRAPTMQLPAPFTEQCDPHELKEQFGSQHPSICNFVYLDGHVQGLSSDIDLVMLRRMSTIADGQTIEMP
jgi:prepilin-type N-terminal cleavage/methylation domain-containing protein/prepilin-type processing-associated H-X9-DG protein